MSAPEHAHAAGGGAHDEDWDSYWGSRSRRRALIEHVRELHFARVFTGEVVALAPRGGRVLEVGSGSGTYLRRLEGLGYRTCGIDISVEAIRYSASRGLRCLVRGDIGALPFRAGSFDVAFNQGVMEHFEDHAFRAIVREMKRVARRVLVIVPSATSVFRLWDPFGDDPHKRFFRRRDLERLLAPELADVRVRYLARAGLLSVAASGTSTRPAAAAMEAGRA